MLASCWYACCNHTGKREPTGGMTHVSAGIEFQSYLRCDQPEPSPQFDRSGKNSPLSALQHLGWRNRKQPILTFFYSLRHPPVYCSSIYSAQNHRNCPSVTLATNSFLHFCKCGFVRAKPAYIPANMELVAVIGVHSQILLYTFVCNIAKGIDVVIPILHPSGCQRLVIHTISVCYSVVKRWYGCCFMGEY